MGLFHEYNNKVVYIDTYIRIINVNWSYVKTCIICKMYIYIYVDYMYNIIGLIQKNI